MLVLSLLSNKESNWSTLVCLALLVSKLKFEGVFGVEVTGVAIISSESSSGDNHFSYADFISSKLKRLNKPSFEFGCSFVHFSTKLASSLSGEVFNLTRTDDLL